MPLLSAVDTSNDVPITPPLYAATVWHFRRTFAPPREHDVTPEMKARLKKRSHIKINANNVNIFSCTNTKRKKKQNSNSCSDRM